MKHCHAVSGIKGFDLLRINSIFTMASLSQDLDWEPLLKAKYPSYTVEVEAFLASLDIATSSEISMEKIYEAIREDSKVDENLKCLYMEAIFGSNKDVRNRIKNRIANFRRRLRYITLIIITINEYSLQISIRKFT